MFYFMISNKYRYGFKRKCFVVSFRLDFVFYIGIIVIF